jgi:hypothetical protein
MFQKIIADRNQHGHLIWLATIMSDKQQDIRKRLSPEKSSANTTPSRRRRVMSTSDSEEERSFQARPAPAAQNHIPNVDVANDAPEPAPAAECDREPAAQEIVQVLSTSSDSDDSMVILLPRQRTTTGAAQQAPIIATNTRGSASRSRVNTRSRVAGQKRSRNPVPKLCGEAEEASTTGDATSDCDESEPDAQMLYRQAISGVRNAHHARTQHHMATMTCPVCAKFAAYLQHFLRLQ